MVLDEELGRYTHDLIRELLPFSRSITGDGLWATLSHIRALLPGLQIKDIPSGTSVFDWTIPNEWNVEEAYIEDASGKRVCDYADNPLHLVGYSEPIDDTMNLFELQSHLYSRPDQPNAIPYITSYYERRWGFCMKHQDREKLQPGDYHVVIRSQLEQGDMAYADLVLPGRTEDEVLFSTYVCHPGMANDGASGIAATVKLAEWLQANEDHRLTYRFVFVPEIVGSVAYLSRNLEYMKSHTIAGFVLTCCGDDRAWSFVPSRLGRTLADRVAQEVLITNIGDDQVGWYSYLDRGSDERQYCSPHVDLPVVSIMRSKYATYPEYHTSLDNLDLVTPKGLAEYLGIMQECILLLEDNQKYKTVHACEPHLGPRGLYPNLSTNGSGLSVRDTMNVLAYCDGNHDLLDLAARLGLPLEQVRDLVAKLVEAGLVDV